MKPLKILSLAILMMCLFGVSILLISPGVAIIQASETNDSSPATSQDDQFVYLPIISKPIPGQNTIVRLVSPENDAQLSTLIPTLIFETKTVPDQTGGCLSFSTVPNPTNCMSSFSLYSNMYRERVLWFNLQPDTTYYWRVGAVLNYDNNTIEWSEERTFVTGPTGGAILPAPILTSPADNSSVDPSTLVLQWNAVPDAIEYDLSIHDTDENRWYGISGIPGSVTQTGPDNLQWIFNMTNGTHFEWYLKARNDYAWGMASTSWNFTIPATTMPADYYVSQNEKAWLNGSEKRVYSQAWSPEPTE